MQTLTTQGVLGPWSKVHLRGRRCKLDVGPQSAAIAARKRVGTPVAVGLSAGRAKFIQAMARVHERDEGQVWSILRHDLLTERP